ncbi:conserved domain protein [Streptococcus constellatus subsp. pharyngis SK1060 = CCUG 46377]|uniref:Conserved domain protein n=1 Tax=Streptococcus constellatus subsp. pharyngis SK1060 = CCUG 46377 TaxID=1035184 RepID=F9P5C5_STRCV|nr:conserved domain protein [Streptococcus constellatus subsp. pharyngis SK1060 = CCUG 46377]
MTYLSAYKTGNLVLPTELLFHFHEIFDNSDDFWFGSFSIYKIQRH